MNSPAEAHGSICVRLDDLIVRQPWNETAIDELCERANAFTQFPGYEYARAYFVGRAYFFKRKHQDALSSFADAYLLAARSNALSSVRRELEQDLCLIGSATALFHLRRYDDARENLSQVRNPDHPELAGRYYGELGWNALRQKQYKEAETAFRNSLRVRSANIHSLNGLGNALFDQKRFEEAREEQLRALNMSDDFAHGWCDLGHANLELGNVREALLNFKMAYKYNLRTPYFFRGAGKAIYRSGNRFEGQRLVDHAEMMENGKVENEFLSAISETLDMFLK